MITLQDMESFHFLISERRFLDAIKLTRKLTGCRLKEAAEYIRRWY